MRPQGGKGDDGSHKACPPPLQRDKCRTSCLRRACDVPTPEDGQRGRPPPPPPTPAPTKERGEDSQEVARGHGGGTGDRPTCRGKRRAASGEKRKKKHHNHEQSKPTSQKKKARRRGPQPRRTGGGRGDMGPHGTQVKYPTTGIWGPQRETPPPTAAATPCACVVLASCLRHACYKGKTTRATRGMTVAECGPPPEDTAAGWGGSGKRVRDEPHDRAQREHAPCKPQRGDDRGCDRRKGRVTTGATWQAPPPCRGTSAAPRACAVLATCLRQRTDSEDAPPPTPFSSTYPRKGRGQRGDSEGTWGWAEDGPKRRKERREASKKKKTTNKGHQHPRAGADSRGRRDMAGARKHGKGRGKGGRPWGRKLGGRDQHRSERGGGPG